MTESDVVLVTGAAGTLGAAVARGFSGFRLVLLDVPQAAERLDALAEELGRDRVLAFVNDWSTDAPWDEALAQTSAELGPVTGAVLCAGGWAGGAVHTSADDETWRRMIGLNADTVHIALRKLLAPMVGRGHGSVVVVGSRQVERPWTGAGAAAYTASKAAVVALARAAAEEVLDHGVRVNAVLPSILDTAPNRASMPDADPSKWVAPESLAQVVAFLLSDAARDVTGAALPVYGRA